MEEMTVKTSEREEFIDITSRVQKVVDDSGVKFGFAFCFIPHTTAAITINENADPDVRHDIISKLRQEFPEDGHYRHSEGNSDAHIKSSLVGPSQQIIVENGKLVLGRWQGLYFCEFDGPRSRRLIVKVVSFD